MKYKVGDKVRIIDKRNSLMNCLGKMDCWLGKVMTIEKVFDEDRSEKEAELTAKLDEIKKIQKEIKEALDNER